MASKSSSPLELETAERGQSWGGNKHIIYLFEKSYTIVDILSFFDKLRVNSDPLKSQVSNQASRLFYTFSGLHFLLKQVHAVTIHGLNLWSSIKPDEVIKHFTSSNEYFIKFIEILMIVEIQYLEMIVFKQEQSLATDYVEEVIINEQMMALEQKVREDQLAIPYLLTVLESEGLHMSASLARGMLCIP